MQHPAFPYDWPDNMHPLAWVFLHLKINGARINLGADDINGMAKWVFDELGAQLPPVEPARQELTLTVAPIDVGKPWSLALEGAAGTTARVVRGQLPPGLALAGGEISGEPTQSGSWLVEVRTGPQVHYQAPLDGPIGTYNTGSWVDIDTPLEYPTPAVDIGDIPDDEFDELERMVHARRAAEAEAADDGQDQEDN